MFSSLPGKFRKRDTVCLPDRWLTGVLLPALADHIRTSRIDLNQARSPLTALAGNQSAPGTSKWVQYRSPCRLLFSTARSTNSTGLVVRYFGVATGRGIIHTSP